MPPRKRKQAARETASDPPAESASSSLEPAKMTVAMLREELDSRGLDTRGKKAELVARLEAELAGTSGPSQGPSPTKKSRRQKSQPKPEPEPEPEPEPMQEEEEATDFSKAVKALKTGDGADSKKKKGRVPKVDPHVPGSGYTVVGEYDCMLNQTNIGQNNNKFYVIQLLETMGRHYLWTRWGRVGETGQSSNKLYPSLESAEKEFCKKFKDKTKNSWEERESFTPVKGKYTLLEMDDEEGGEEELVEKLTALDETDAPPPSITRQCSLDKPTQDLIKLIFDHDMFKSAMQSLEIDTKKLPLGKLSKSQIAKGVEALEAIEEALSSGAPKSQLAELSSKFYTIIPHSFGRNVPPVIADHERLQKKFDMLLVLGDIELAQGLEKDQEKKQKKVAGEMPHPLDVNYQSLNAKLTHIKQEEEDYDVIHKYLVATGHSHMKILDVFRVDREGAGERFSAHDVLENRRLLWHGTNVAVVAAILKSGLRIMPHSGGRVGKGIYFASECSKSAGYVGCAAGNTGIMFLNEVALGKEKHIKVGDHQLTRAPQGYDSIVAKGHTEPDPGLDTSLTLDGKEVAVPQGRPTKQAKFSDSHFSQSEYLIYNESQNRIRYLLKMKMY